MTQCRSSAWKPALPGGVETGHGDVERIWAAIVIAADGLKRGMAGECPRLAVVAGKGVECGSDGRMPGPIWAGGSHIGPLTALVSN
jgi:hypothetical protein